jgi:hypothetical protein
LVSSNQQGGSDYSRAVRSRLPFIVVALGALVLTGCSATGKVPAAAASDLCDQVRQAAKQASNSSQELLVQLRSQVQAAAPGSTYSATDLIAGRFPGSDAPSVATLRRQLSAAVKSEMTTIVGQPQCFSSGELTMAKQALAPGGAG